MRLPPRVRYAVALLIIIAAGLLARRPELGLPWPIAKWTGSVLWGAMVYLLVVLIRPNGNRNASLCIALAIAVLVEFSRLYHADWLDEFRKSTAGGLLLGRLFSPWNIAAYALGIAAGWIADRWLRR
jgi:hypothetical protein